jgi:phage/plasmid-associated DNA primase
MKEIPFLTKFEHPNESIRAKLTEPEPAGVAILAWAFEGYKQWRQRSLRHVPSAIQAATNDYQSEMDPLKDVLPEIAVTTEKGWVTRAKIFGSYIDWAKANGIKFPLTRTAFFDRLRVQFSEVTRRGVRGFSGLGLRGDSPEGAFSPPKSAPIRHRGADFDSNSEVLQSVHPRDKENMENAAPQLHPAPHRLVDTACSCPRGTWSQAKLGGDPCPVCERTIRCQKCLGCRRCTSVEREAHDASVPAASPLPRMPSGE